MTESSPALPALDCNVLVEIITDYLEGKLPSAEHERFEAHAGRCPGCKAYVEQMRATLAMAGRLTEESLLAPFRDRLLVAFRDWQAGR